MIQNGSYYQCRLNYDKKHKILWKTRKFVLGTPIKVIPTPYEVILSENFLGLDKSYQMTKILSISKIEPVVEKLYSTTSSLNAIKNHDSGFSPCIRNKQKVYYIFENKLSTIISKRNIVRPGNHIISPPISKLENFLYVKTRFVLIIFGNTTLLFYSTFHLYVYVLICNKFPLINKI